MPEPNPFKWRHYQAEIILLCVRWYLRYSLSYRDLEEMMAERGLTVDHSTIARWVLAYAPELEKRVKPQLKPTTDSWREHNKTGARQFRSMRSLSPWLNLDCKEPTIRTRGHAKVPCRAAAHCERTRRTSSTRVNVLGKCRDVDV